MSAAALAGFALALAVAAGSPGPSVAALVARVMSNGFRDVLPFLAAMWIGEAIWLALVLAGLSVVAQRFGFVLTVVRFGGVAYLLYLAWKMWTAPAEPVAGTLPGTRRPWRMFFAGMTITLGNPKIMVFYLALVPTILDLARVGLSDAAALIAITVAVLVVVDLGWAFAAVRARRLLTNRRAVRLMNRTSATVMAGAAAAVAAQ
ncbi:MAG TPA: LysE family translocator [Stellaceae bacterium]|nr:LysE family translocator [Stellaceae bacterium]